MVIKGARKIYGQNINRNLVGISPENGQKGQNPRFTHKMVILSKKPSFYAWDLIPTHISSSDQYTHNLESYA